MTYLTRGGDASSFEKVYPANGMVEAMHRAVATIVGLQHKILGDKKRPNSLNLCATDGTTLLAYRFRNHVTSQPPSLYYSTKVSPALASTSKTTLLTNSGWNNSQSQVPRQRRRRTRAGTRDRSARRVAWGASHCCFRAQHSTYYRPFN